MDRTLEERVDHRPTHSHSATKPSRQVPSQSASIRASLRAQNARTRVPLPYGLTNDRALQLPVVCGHGHSRSCSRSHA